MKLFHGSYKQIENFKNAPIWCSNLFDTANNYILAQSENEVGEFGYIYEVEIDESEIIAVDDFVAVDCGSILNGMEGNVFSAESEAGDVIFVIRDASKFNFKAI